MIKFALIEWVEQNICVRSNCLFLHGQSSTFLIIAQSIGHHWHLRTIEHSTMSTINMTHTQPLCCLFISLCVFEAKWFVPSASQNESKLCLFPLKIRMQTTIWVFVWNFNCYECRTTIFCRFNSFQRNFVLVLRCFLCLAKMEECDCAVLWFCSFRRLSSSTECCRFGCIYSHNIHWANLNISSKWFDMCAPMPTIIAYTFSQSKQTAYACLTAYCHEMAFDSNDRTDVFLITQ